jgi:TolB-like protein
MKTGFVLAPISIRTRTSSLCRAVLLLGVAALLQAGVPRSLAASYELVSREATGYGESEDAALANALVEAIRQVRGLTVDAERSLRTSLAETESGRGLKVELDERIRSRSQGLIHSYEVMALARQDGRWLARVLATMPQYRSPGPDRDHLRSIAVLPFRARAASVTGLTRRWEQKLVTHIVQSRRFRVVDREYSTELDQEQARWRSGEAPMAELVRVGQQLGADYVVVGELTHFELLPRGGDPWVEDVSFIVEYRVIEPATGEIRWANTRSTVYDRHTLLRLGLRTRPQEATEHLLNTSADTVVTEILDLIYPIKVLRIEPDGTLLFSQGGKRLQPGQWFSVHAPGETVQDPDTGLTARPDGVEVALATVIRVQDKWSWARVEQGERELIREGMVCRRLSEERLAVLQPPPPPEPAPEPPDQAAYSVAARRMIAEELLGMDETTFARHFTLVCTRVAFEQPVTVKATFHLARQPDPAGTPIWSRLFSVTERFSSTEYTGLTAPETVERVVNVLKERITADSHTLGLLRDAELR